MHGQFTRPAKQTRTKTDERACAAEPASSQSTRLEPMGNYQYARSPMQLRNKPNQTGLPDSLKTGIETLSGMSMDHVRVHYNSNKPRQLNALAYAQGSNIHLAQGQEQHLPHEAWHVVQQAEGRVKPTLHANGHAINDNQQLEQEANQRGNQAMQLQSSNSQPQRFVLPNDRGLIQRQLDEDFNAAGTTSKKNLKACEDFAKIVSDLVDQAYDELMAGKIKDWTGAKIAAFLDLLDRNSIMAVTHVGNAMEERVYALMDETDLPLKWTKQRSDDMGGTSYPDIVLNLDDEKEGLIDITSDRGHVLGKSGGWTTSERYVYVAEAYFDSVTMEDLPNIKNAIKEGGITKKHAKKLKKEADRQRQLKLLARQQQIDEARELYNQYSSFSAFVIEEFSGNRTKAGQYMRRNGLGNLKGVPKLKGRRKLSDEGKKKRKKIAMKEKQVRKKQKLDDENEEESEHEAENLESEELEYDSD
ncbi:MAG: DUF4157 domain-containing protein [Undibacterium umbellatum]|uniref:eCIS core domain-containing protein n=1 Tax=Undibacterium umbellatum TaxID=2762300 RepID=UPI003BB70252